MIRSPWPTLPQVRITTGHLVSDSMVSRAYLKDTWGGVVVIDDMGQLWLVSTRGALVPDQAEMKRRGHAAGGPSPVSSRARIVKLDINWVQASGRITDAEQLERKNPLIVCHPEGADIAVLLLGRVADEPGEADKPNGKDREAGAIPSGLAQSAPGLAQSARLPDTNELVVAATHQIEDEVSWTISLSCRPASSPGFGGEAGAVALTVDLALASSGSPAYSVSDDGPALEGLVRPLSLGLSVLLPTHLIAETIAYASASAGE